MSRRPMPNFLNSVSDLDPIYFNSPSGAFERAILYGVLERALMDLQPHADSADRRNALCWFRAEEIATDKDDHRFTFAQIVEHLDFGALELKRVFKAVVLAEHLERI